MKPLITIILPTYNGAFRIERAMKSVLNQSFSDWEFIVVDDGSVDNTQKVVGNLQKQDRRIIFIKNESNLGIQKTLNKGLCEAQGEYIARIDDDDEWIDLDKLAKQIEFLEHHPDHVLVGTNAIICNEQGKELARYAVPQDDEKIRARMLSRNCFLHPSILARKSAIIQVGGYNEEKEVRHVEDYDLWLQLGCVGKFANIETGAVRLTIRSGSLTFQNRLAQAKKVMHIARQYRKKYPNFLRGQIILLARVVGFIILTYIPFPDTVLYKIQKWYKKL